MAEVVGLVDLFKTKTVELDFEREEVVTLFLLNAFVVTDDLDIAIDILHKIYWSCGNSSPIVSVSARIIIFNSLL